MNLSSRSANRASDPLNRVWRVLLPSGNEWAVIAAEPASARSIYWGYVLPLAAIPPLAYLLHAQLLLYHLLGFPAAPFARAAALTAFARYILNLLGIYVFALIVNGLAPAFGGEKNRVQALKLVAYSSTPIWLSGVASLDHSLHLLVYFAAYGLYLFVRGLPVLMKVPADRTIPYAAATVIGAVVVSMAVATAPRAVKTFGDFAAVLFGGPPPDRILEPTDVPH